MQREVDIESYLVRKLKAIGARADKFKTPGRRHAPDRIVLMPTAFCFFVECKKPGESLRPGQAREKRRLEKLGFNVEVIDTKEQVDLLIGRLS